MFYLKFCYFPGWNDSFQDQGIINRHMDIPAVSDKKGNEYTFAYSIRFPQDDSLFIKLISWHLFQPEQILLEPVRPVHGSG